VPKTSNIEAWSKVTPWGENALRENDLNCGLSLTQKLLFDSNRLGLTINIV